MPLQSAEWIKVYADRRGQAVQLVDSPTVAAAIALQHAGPTKTIRCRDGRHTRIAVLYTPPPLAVKAAS